MADKILRFQKKFSKQNKIYLSKTFNCQQGETVLFGFWKSFFSRKGFLFTEKNVYFNIPAEIICTEGNEKTIQKNGFISRETDTHVEFKTEIVETNLILSIILSDRTLFFNLGSNFSDEKIEKIQNLFRNYFTAILFPEDAYCMEDNLFRKKIFDIKDSFFYFIYSIKIKIFEWKKNRKERDSKDKNRDEKNNSVSENPVKKGFISFAQNFLDIFEDFYLIFIVLCKTYSSDFISSKQFYIFLIFYFVAKLLTAFIVKKSAKPVPVLIISVITINALMSGVNFTVFLTEYVILFVAYQISSNHHIGTIIAKSIILLAAMFVIYVVFLCLINEVMFDADAISKSHNPFASAIQQIFKTIRETFVTHLLSHNQL